MKSKSSSTRESVPKRKSKPKPVIQADIEGDYDLDALDKALAEEMTWEEVEAANPKLKQLRERLEGDMSYVPTTKEQKVIDKVTGGERIRKKKDWIDSWRGRLYVAKEQQGLLDAMRRAKELGDARPEKVRQLAREVANLTPEERKRMDPYLLEALEKVWREEQYKKASPEERKAMRAEERIEERKNFGRAMTPEQTQMLEEMVERQWERDARINEPIPKWLMDWEPPTGD